MRFLEKLGTLFMDKAGDVSSKRVGMFWLMYLLFLLVRGSLLGNTINSDVLYIVGGLLAFSMGAITSEFISFISQNNKKGNGKKDESS